MYIEHLMWGDPRYERQVMHRGHHWFLYLNQNQRHLGRSYAWLIGRHESNMPFDALTSSELAELFDLIAHYREAIEKLWQPVRINTAWLGNEVDVHGGHGHLHLVPRYDVAPIFHGREFTDPDPRKNFGGQPRLRLSDTELGHIRGEIVSVFRN